MRASAFLVLGLLAGCAIFKGSLVFDIRSADVVSASAETLDVSRRSDDFKGQIHIVFSERGVESFHHFLQSNAGSLFELRVNGEVLLPAASARPAGGREAWFFTATVEDARWFAASLNGK